MTENWPFADPPNVATFTVRQITRGGEPILLVAHDEDDGGWQFLTGGPVTMADAMLVALKEIVKIDPTVAKLADLQLGWQASRPAVGKPWTRTKSPVEPAD